MDFTSSAATTRGGLHPGWAPVTLCAPKDPVPVAPVPQCLGCTARGRCLPAGLSDKEARCLGRITIGRRRVRKGQAVYRERDRFFFLYAVRFGTFKSAVMLNKGSDQVTAFHLPGDIMGLDATVSGRHPTTAIALEDAEVCALPYSQLTAAFSEAPGLNLQVLRMAGAELVRDQRLLTLIANTHSEQRVAAFLLSLSQRMRERGFSPNEFLLRMTRAEIGSYLGTTLETVSRSLSSFARRGFITVRRREIHLVDPEALRGEFETALP